MLSKNDKDTLIIVLKRMFGKNIINADYEVTKLDSGVCDNVRLITGIAETSTSEELSFKVILKKQKKISPPLSRFDAEAWKREYYFYASDFYKLLDDNIGMPQCYHSEFLGEEYILWLEYIEGYKKDLTIDDLEYISGKLGAFHGKIYTQPELTSNISCLSFTHWMEKNIQRRHKSPEYDYLRSEAFDVPEHLKCMLIEIEDNKEEILEKMKALPIVLFHGDFHDGNLFLKDGKIILYDWGHGAGLGYLGEDIANLIAEFGIDYCDLWVEYYRRFIPAYLKEFSEYMDISGIENFYIKEMIILYWGYEIVQAYMSAENEDDKAKQITALQQIYDMGK